MIEIKENEEAWGQVLFGLCSLILSLLLLVSCLDCRKQHKNTQVRSIIFMKIDKFIYFIKRNDSTILYKSFSRIERLMSVASKIFC